MYIPKLTQCKDPHKKYKEYRDVEYRENIVKNKCISYLIKAGVYPDLSRLVTWVDSPQSKRLFRKIHYWNRSYGSPFLITSEHTSLTSLLECLFFHQTLKQIKHIAYDYTTPDDYEDFIKEHHIQATLDTQKYISDKILEYWAIGYPKKIAALESFVAGIQDEKILSYAFDEPRGYSLTGFNLNFEGFYWFHKQELTQQKVIMPEELENNFRNLAEKESLWSYEFIIMYFIERDIPFNWDGYFSNIDDMTYYIEHHALTLLSYYIQGHPEKLGPLAGGLWRYSDLLRFFKDDIPMESECELFI